MNCIDQNYKDGFAKYYVKGGSYKYYDPSSSNSENPTANFCAEGYCSSAKGDYFTVSATNPVATSSDAAGQFASLPDAIEATTDGGTVTLLENVSVNSKVEVRKNLTIDLNDKTIKNPSCDSEVNFGFESHTVTAYAGNVTLENGKIVGRLNVYDAATVNLANDLAVVGSVVVWGDGTYGTEGCKTPTLNVYGTISNTTYSAITTNGTDMSAPVVNIHEGAVINASESGAIYAPSNGTTTITGAKVAGSEFAIEVRAGKLIVNDSSLKATASNFTCNPNGNGSTTTGAALAIAQHTTQKNIEVLINNGTFEGVKAINESNPQGNVPAPQVKLDVKNGVFKGAISAVDVSQFISGGTFSINPANEYKVQDALTRINVVAGGNTFTVLSGDAARNLKSGVYTSKPKSIAPGYEATQNSDGTWMVSEIYYPDPSPITPTPTPEPSAPVVGDKTEGVEIGGGSSTEGGSTAGSTKVDVTVTDTTATTDSKGNKVDGAVSIDKIATTGTAVAIPETITTDKGTFLVTSIPAGAMEGNSTATTVAIPESVTTIGEGAFSNCTALTTVTVPAGVTEIAFGTFAGCTSLETVEIQGEVTQIASNAFSGCESLSSVTIPETVTTIGSGAFSGCSNLTRVTVPAGVTTISQSTFAGCSNLSTVEVKSELTEIAADAFNGCESLTSMTVAGTVRPLAVSTRAASSALVIPASVTKIGDRAFKGTGITSVTVPAGVKMGTGVFRDCKQLTKAAVAKGVKTLGSYTFKGCSALKSVTIPGTVTKIERSAFSGCKSLAKVTIPKGVTSIGKNALYGASKVKTLTVNSKKLTKSSVKGALAGSKVATVKVPKSMLKSYAKVFAKSVVGKTVKVRAI